MEDEDDALELESSGPGSMTVARNHSWRVFKIVGPSVVYCSKVTFVQSGDWASIGAMSAMGESSE